LRGVKDERGQSIKIESEALVDQVSLITASGGTSRAIAFILITKSSDDARSDFPTRTFLGEGFRPLERQETFFQLHKELKNLDQREIYGNNKSFGKELHGYIREAVVDLKQSIDLLTKGVSLC
jgi:hypothetical protein